MIEGLSAMTAPISAKSKFQIVGTHTSCSRPLYDSHLCQCGVLNGLAYTAHVSVACRHKQNGW